MGFLQKMNGLVVPDLFILVNSEGLVKFQTSDSLSGCNGRFSADVQDLLYCLPRGLLMSLVNDCAILLQGSVMTQAKGVIIGSKVAPILRSIFLRGVDRE